MTSILKHVSLARKKTRKGMNKEENLITNQFGYKSSEIDHYCCLPFVGPFSHFRRENRRIGSRRRIHVVCCWICSLTVATNFSLFTEKDILKKNLSFLKSHELFHSGLNTICLTKRRTRCLLPNKLYRLLPSAGWVHCCSAWVRGYLSAIVPNVFPHLSLFRLNKLNSLQKKISLATCVKQVFEIVHDN